MKLMRYSLLLGLVMAAVNGPAQVPWPLLHPFPVEPGDHPLRQIRLSLMGRFDADRDGFLDRYEREELRRSTKKEAAERSRKVRALLEKEEKKEEHRPPKRWLELYDKNNNGRFDGQEWDRAMESEVRRVTEIFDRNQDGKVREDERERLIDDLKSSELNEYDQYIHRVVGGLEKPKRGEEANPTARWRKFDFDGDGKADPDELEAIRKHEQQHEE